jgi:hypothetical protein
MTLRKRSLSAKHVGFLLVMILTLASVASAEWKEKVLYSFQGGSDGSTPAGGVVFDSAGNLYGATTDGGANNCPGPAQCGTVYQLTPPAQKGGSWSESILYIFKGKKVNDGSTPAGGVILDMAGNLYGTTAYGGAGNCILLGGNVGCGTVWKLTPPKQKGGQWTESVIYSFQGGKDGDFPNGDLTFDSAGNLYGATLFGGGKGTTCNILFGGQCGTVFKLSPSKQKGGKWTEKVLHHFAGGTKGEQSSDGAEPNGGLVLDSAGAVYGTTYYGGNNSGDCDGGVGGIGCGTVFKLVPPISKGGAWTEETLYHFGGANDGSNPAAGVVSDAKGDLYGTTYFGPQNGYGTIFEVARPQGKSRSWKETILYRFKDGADGAYPAGPLTFNAYGGLYGTAEYGGGASIYGDVFVLKPPSQGKSWTFDTLYGFGTRSGGGAPAAKLVSDGGGNFYSTTGGGGDPCSTCGTVFELSP